MNFRFTKMQDLPFLGEKSFAVRFPFWDISLQTVDGLRINHGEIRSTSHTQKSDCTFSLPYGHDKMLDIGMAEFGRFCTGGTTSTKWITDSHKTFLAMRDMLSSIHAAVDGDPGVMRRIQVFGIVGSGEHAGPTQLSVADAGRNHLSGVFHDCPDNAEARRTPTGRG
jgi:hypothetical protein